ncbi:heavy metal translocating P-type ATPase [Quadrisphaera sp. KR29]|uniref:heavy metal translocating P-type ATPase n=1 Tax=Quadrisphaera sp. KR29 TaxID=3461391 RepID=UPI004044ADEF
MLDHLAGAPTAAAVLNAAALLAGAWTFMPGALRRLVRGRLGVGLLMTIAAAGAVALGHLGEAAALAFLFSIAEALEDRAMDRAQHGLRALLALVPPTARVERPAQPTGSPGEHVVPAVQVRTGDVLLLAAGERVATDAVVLTGRSALDTSAVTGESIPVEVGPGEPVPAGSVNGTGTLRLRAVADGRDNSLTQIVRLVEAAHARKGQRARLADRIARPLVPAVLALAALVALYGVLVGEPELWLQRALVVLVAASPCAMAIAVPVTVISAIGAASKLGVVIKSGQAFEDLGAVRQVHLDKTGTLTRGTPQVVAVATISPVAASTSYNISSSASGTSADRVLRAAAAIEAGSTHPLAHTLLTAATLEQADSATLPDATDVHEHPGQGISGHWGGTAVRVGSTRWIDPGALTGDVEQMTAAGMTVVLVEIDGHLTGAIGVRDELRPEAAEAVALLRQQGLAVSMLTGDDARTAHALASQAGITDVRAAQTPADKASAVHPTASSRGGTAMVGDGINDAPALATATVGIAMGLTGSAAAIESADVAFTGTDLRLLPRAFAHARRGRSIMTANIALALAIIVVLVPLALFGVLGLAAVVLVHEVAEVIVIANGARAARLARRRRVTLEGAEVTGTDNANRRAASATPSR